MLSKRLTKVFVPLLYLKRLYALLQGYPLFFNCFFCCILNKAFKRAVPDRSPGTGAVKPPSLSAAVQKAIIFFL